MEYQVLDRLSFQRFLGLRRSSQIPDRTTFWTFRERLTVAKAGDALFEAVHRQLAQHGDIARGGLKSGCQFGSRSSTAHHGGRTSTDQAAGDARGLETGPAMAERHRGHLDPEARQILLRLQGLGQRRPTLQADSQSQGQHRFRERHPPLGECPGSCEHPP